MSNLFSDRVYYEAALTGSANVMSKETMARKALDLIDRASRVLMLHSVPRNEHGSEVARCKHCDTVFPCQTVRALTGA